MAKKSHDPDDRPRPKPKTKRPSKDDPPPVRLRPGEEDDEEDDFDLRPQAQKGAGMPEFDDRGRRVNQRRKRMWQNVSTFLTLLMVLSFFGVGLYMLIWAKKPVPPDPDMMAFVPPNTSLIYGCNMTEARYNEKFQMKMDGSIERGVPPYLRSVMSQLKLRTADLDRVIIACDSYIPLLSIQQSRGNLENSGSTGVTAVLKLRRTAWQSKDQRDRNDETVDIQFSGSDLQQATGAEEREYNGKRYYAGRSFDGTPYYYHGASAHVLVITESERNMKDLLGKPDSQIVVSGPIKQMADQLGGENFWYGMVFAGVAGDYNQMTDPIGFGGKVLRSQAGGEVGFGFAGGVYNHGVDFTNVTYFADPGAARALKEAAEELYKGMAEILNSLNQLSGDTISLDAKFKLDELSNAKFSVSGNLFTYSTRFRTSVWEELLETGVKVGNQTVRLPYPFFKGPFGGLDTTTVFGGGGAGPGQGGGMNAIWGPGGGIAIGGP